MPEISRKKEENSKFYRSLLDQTPTAIIAVDSEFNLTFINAEGCSRTGKTYDELLGNKCYDLFHTNICQTGNCPIRQAMDKDQHINGRTEARLNKVVTPIEFYAAPLKDTRGNLIGGLEFVVDITEKVVAEEDARKSRELLIQELSTPVLSLWDDILAIPLIGTLDSRRTQEAMEIALTRMADEKALILIVDITGVPIIDTLVANHLIQMAAATRLMGGDCVLTGISPATARTIIHLGIDLSGINTRATLAEGLKFAMKLAKTGRDERS